MAHSENFSSDVRSQSAHETDLKATAYCEQRISRQYQGEDHENTVSRLHESMGSRFSNKFDQVSIFNYNSLRHIHTGQAFTKGQESPCKNDFYYRG